IAAEIAACDRDGGAADRCGCVLNVDMTRSPMTLRPINGLRSAVGCCVMLWRRLCHWPAIQADALDPVVGVRTRHRVSRTWKKDERGRGRAEHALHLAPVSC